nr:uncharacterized protein LOC111510441 isoform X2 [Leptinotarsa decemlineata]
MLILFHYLGFCLYQFLRNRKRIKFLESIEKRKLSLLDNTEVVKDLENNLKFEPPVFRQRYGKVFEILLDERWRKQIKKLCDFGCAEFGLFIFLKRLSSLNNIFCIDIEECTLRENIGRIHPLTVEYLRRRESPLQISVFAGSVADPDYRLECTDAVVAIELIEHLYPDALDAFPYNIFAFVEPKLVIITTPNSDFNILFSSDPKRMRHYDHKFEWNREQFQDWANNIVTRFPDYTVTFSGIGEGPAGTEILGECSQMAVFVRMDMLDDSYISVSYSSPCICDSNSPCKGLTELAKMLCTCTCMLCCPNFSHGVCTYMSFSKHISDFEIQENDEANPSYGIYYKFIEKVDYPFYCDDRTEEQKMIDEFRYRINTFGHFRGRFFVEERNRSEIPLVDLIYGPDSCFISQSELSKLLTKYDYKIEECIIQETGQLENCVIYEPVMEKYSSSSEASGYESDIPMYQPNDESLSDWDDWDEPYIKEESNENFESSTELISSEVSPPENQSDVEEQNNQSQTVMDAGYQNSSCNDLPKTCSREQNYAFGQALSCEDLTSKNRKIRFSNTVDKKSFTFPEINESNQFQKIVEIRPGRTFMNNFLNPRAERVDKSGEIDWCSEPGPSSAIHVPQIKKKILKNSSSENLVTAKSISDSIVENVFSTLEKKSESSKVVTNQVPEENSFPLAVENERKIEEPATSDVIRRETRTKSPTGVKEKSSDVLMDSNHQNSSPPNTLPENSEETDFFEETSTTPKLSSEDNKIYLKKLVNLEKSIFVPLATSSHQKIKTDPNRINELDKFSNILPGRTFFNHFLSPQGHISRKSVMRDRDRDSSPGPSNLLGKKRKKTKKGGSFTDVEDYSPMDDIKSITNCIVENSLNKLNIVEIEKIKDDVIEFNIPPEWALVPFANIQEPVMENFPGNSGRDIEGNPNNGTESNGRDTENGNIELNGRSVENEAPNVEDRHNSGHPTSLFTEFANEGIPSTSQQLENQVARASREALFDPNSVQDLLEDFEIPAPLQEAVDILDVGNNVVLLGIRSIASNINPQENGFPHWLLQIMGTQAVPDGSITSTSSDEPHYYCQGDGLGVHPSITAVEVEDEEDEETTSSNNTDFAEVDQGVSSQQDMSSLPEDSQGNTESQEFPEETDDGLRMETTEQTEYFDTVSSSSDTGIDSSKST